MLGERFHMDDDLVRSLNPTLAEARPGDKVNVVNVARATPRKEKAVSRIVASIIRGAVTAYDASENVLAVYPATIGSEHTPTPPGSYEVTRIAVNPTYSYNPEKNFQQGDNVKPLTLPSGPNNPVGSVWIALSKPTFGIHGTPEPSKVSKTNSHGCVRLTNWDAQDLAKMTKPGTKVEFVDE